MDTKNLDEKLKQALTGGTEFEAEAREEVWNNIDRELFEDNIKGDIIRMRKRRGLVKLAASVAAAAVLIIGLNTQPGLALVNRIREMFEPEKNITQDIEGSEEKQNVQLNEGRDAEYVIYVDQDRYEFIKGQDADSIVPNPPLPERYPEVSMEIKQVNAKSPEVLIQEIEAQLREAFSDVTVPERVEQPVSGWTVRGLEGSRWDSPLERVYVLDNQREGSFVITQRYFLEAEEGHGARF
ncbi:MAG: hypothetical protein PHS13_10290, partial [Firmicutes bacterium]|nr:hypothetical protein [Bacillota bacterium]